MSFSFGSSLASEKRAPPLRLGLHTSPRKKPTHLDSKGLDEANCTTSHRSRAPSCNQHPRCASNPLLGESKSQNTDCLAEGSNECPSYITSWDRGLKPLGNSLQMDISLELEDVRKPSEPSAKVHGWLPISNTSTKPLIPKTVVNWTK